MKMEHSVPKRRSIKFRRRGIAHKELEPNLFPYKYHNILKPSHSSYLPACEVGTVFRNVGIKNSDAGELSRRKLEPNLFLYIYPKIPKPSHSSHVPSYEDGTECSETSVYKIQTPVYYPEESSSQTFSRIYTPTLSNLVILHTYPPMKMEQCVPKRRHIKFRRRELPRRKRTIVPIFFTENLTFCVFLSWSGNYTFKRLDYELISS